MEIKFKFCPRCGLDLRKNIRHAQGVYECVECGTFFIVSCILKDAPAKRVEPAPEPITRR
jgi:ribosomal protein L37AE/L43A